MTKSNRNRDQAGGGGEWNEEKQQKARGGSSVNQRP